MLTIREITQLIRMLFTDNFSGSSEHREVIRNSKKYSNMTISFQKKYF